MSLVIKYKTIALVDNKQEEIIVRNQHTYHEIQGHSSAFCKCGVTLSIKEPEYKGCIK